MTLRLTLTLIPRGDERQARELGRVEIENDCMGTEAAGNYRVTMRGIRHADAELRGVDRAKGPWWLVLEALRALVG